MPKEIDLGRIIPVLVKNLNGTEEGALDASVGLIITDLFNKFKNSQTLTLFATNWSENYPYSQTVVVDGIKETDTPFIGLYLPAGLTEDNIDDQKKAFDDLYRAESGNGYITFYAYKKPVLDFQIVMKGV